VARDAIARQYDVDKNSIILDIPGGLITFRAKQGKSIDLDRLHESLRATRLSGRTGMEVRYLELNVRGKLVAGPGDPGTMRLKVAGTGQEFLLGAGTASETGAENPLQRLRAALAKGENVVSVTGRVQGWKGLFPDVLRVLAEQRPGGGDPGARQPPTLIVTRFQIGDRPPGVGGRTGPQKSQER
jgi:hypothetical protein